jgi:excinuclease ABC subunit C
MVGLAKSRLVEPSAFGTRRVVGRRAALRARGASPGDARGERTGGRAEALADAAEVHEAGYVAELARSPERVFLPGRKDPVVLRQNSAELFLLARLRDEAHRFAITFHRKLRRERNFQSVLEEIPGVGEGRKKALLRHFGSLKRVRDASAEELAQVEGFGPRQAQAVRDFFHGGAGGAGGEGEGEAVPPPGTAGGVAEAAAPEAGVSEADIDAALADEAGEPVTSD